MTAHGTRLWQRRDVAQGGHRRRHLHQHRRSPTSEACHEMCEGHKRAPLLLKLLLFTY